MANPQIYAGFMTGEDSNLYEVQRTNNFRINIDLTEFVQKAGVSTDAIGLIGLACETSGLPNNNTDPLEVPYGNNMIKVAGKTQFDDISITVKDFIEQDLEKVLMYWRYEVYNPETGKVGWAKNYKREARITLYSPNGTRERTWVAQGVWPTSIELGDLDYSSSDLRKLTMTLAVDNAFLDRDNFSLGAGDYGTSGNYNDIQTSW